MATSKWFLWAKDQGQSRRVAILAEAPIFAGLPRRFLARVAAKLFEKAYETGDMVFSAGEPGKGLFVVEHGSVAIVQTTAQGEQVLDTLGPGACFGELALIDDLPRSASARVLETSRLLILYRSDFEAMVEGDRAIVLTVMRNLLRRLATYVRRSNTTFAALAERGSPVTGAIDVQAAARRLGS